MAEFSAPPPAIGSFLLASADPGRLRGWYESAFGVTADTDGFLRFGEVGLLVDSRDDVAATAVEPARVILNLHVADAEVVQEPTDQPYGVRDCAFRDPAGNLIRIQELR